MLMMSAKGRGLFQGAIAQSDPFNQPWPRLARMSAPGQPTAEQWGERTATAVLGLPSNATAAQLRAVPSEKLLYTVQNSAEAGGTPIIDGEYVADRGADAFQAGRIARVPYIITTNSWEGSLTAMFTTTGDHAIQSLGADRDRVLATYPEAVRGDSKLLGSLVFGDISWLAPQRTAAKAASAHGVPTRTMHFEHVPEDLRGNGLPGAGHCSDVPYEFDNLSMRYTTNAYRPNADDRSIASTLHGYWVNFAKTGNPNGPGLPAWPPFTPDVQNTLVVGDRGPKVVVNPDAARMDVLEPVSLAIMRATP
jgi:para-nitrobenzyl esterase